MKGERLIVWLPIVDPLKEGKFGLWWYRTHELVPQKVCARRTDSKWSWKNILRESVGMKTLAQKTFEVPELKWTLDYTSDLLSFFTRSARSASLSFFTRSARFWFSHIRHKMCPMILPFFTRNAQSVLCFHIHAGFYKNSCTESTAHRSARWESVLLCVSRLYTGEMFKGRRERQLQQVSDILRQKMQGETATSSSCLFMLSLLNLHMLAGLYLQSL